MHQAVRDYQKMTGGRRPGFSMNARSSPVAYVSNPEPASIGTTRLQRDHNLLVTNLRLTMEGVVPGCRQSDDWYRRDDSTNDKPGVKDMDNRRFPCRAGSRRKQHPFRARTTGVVRRPPRILPRRRNENANLQAQEGCSTGKLERQPGHTAHRRSIQGRVD